MSRKEAVVTAVVGAWVVWVDTEVDAETDGVDTSGVDGAVVLAVAPVLAVVLAVDTVFAEVVAAVNFLTQENSIISYESGKSLLSNHLLMLVGNKLD